MKIRSSELFNVFSLLSRGRAEGRKTGRPKQQTKHRDAHASLNHTAHSCHNFRKQSLGYELKFYVALTGGSVQIRPPRPSRDATHSTCCRLKKLWTPAQHPTNATCIHQRPQQANTFAWDGIDLCDGLAISSQHLHAACSHRQVVPGWGGQSREQSA